MVERLSTTTLAYKRMKISAEKMMIMTNIIQGITRTILRANEAALETISTFK